jgi:hypothetical protein
MSRPAHGGHRPDAEEGGGQARAAGGHRVEQPEGQAQHQGHLDLQEPGEHHQRQGRLGIAAQPGQPVPAQQAHRHDARHEHAVEGRGQLQADQRPKADAHALQPGQRPGLARAQQDHGHGEGERQKDRPEHRLPPHRQVLVERLPDDQQAEKDQADHYSQRGFQPAAHLCSFQTDHIFRLVRTPTSSAFTDKS